MEWCKDAYEQVQTGYIWIWYSFLEQLPNKNIDAFTGFWGYLRYFSGGGIQNGQKYDINGKWQGMAPIMGTPPDVATGAIGGGGLLDGGRRIYLGEIKRISKSALKNGRKVFNASKGSLYYSAKAWKKGIRGTVPRTKIWSYPPAISAATLWGRRMSRRQWMIGIVETIIGGGLIYGSTR